MNAVRFGSYSMVATFAGTPSLSRRKSILRYLILLPPPWWRTVILPCLLRPALFFLVSRRDFSGVLVVTSSKVSTDMNRLAGEVGL